MATGVNETTTPVEVEWLTVQSVTGFQVDECVDVVSQKVLNISFRARLYGTKRLG